MWHFGAFAGSADGFQRGASRTTGFAGRADASNSAANGRGDGAAGVCADIPAVPRTTANVVTANSQR